MAGSQDIIGDFISTYLSGRVLTLKAKPPRHKAAVHLFTLVLQTLSGWPSSATSTGAILDLNKEAILFNQASVEA